jgi:YfiH family protein
LNSEVEWIAADWPAPDGVVAGCSLRQGGVSQGKYASLNLAAHVADDEAAVLENRRRFKTQCGLPAEPRWLSQVHGTNVAREPDSGLLAKADAAFTANPDVVCAVLTADCLPLLITSADGGELAAAHAGWRGLNAGVIEATLNQFTVSPGNLLAWLGPAISQTAFEVGDEVRAAFVANDAAAADCFVENQRGRWQADLYALARQRLARAGIKQVFGGNFCTYAESGRFFSYRRDGECGRMASFIYSTSQGPKKRLK